MIEKQQRAELEILKKYRVQIEKMDPLRPMGKVVQVSGFSIISEGPPEVSIGDICRVEINEGKGHLSCEVIGFKGHRLILMPLGPITGIFPEASVLTSSRRACISVSPEMRGRIFDGNGRPLDKKGPIISEEQRYADNDPPGPTSRILIRKHVETGVKAIDSMLTIGRGQRIGIFSGSGVGKSTLLGMIARHTRADVNVICLVGERGREVREFIENDLGKFGLQKSVVFVATSDRSSMEKVNCAGFAMSVAEYFRDQGHNVNLMLDSLTRYCMALREIGIASGDQIGPGGYPPGVWFRLSRLVERAASLEHGSITGFFTVLVEADDMNEPVADNTRGILDGHIVLSRKMAQHGHFPAIDITESVSRVMNLVISPEHNEYAVRLRSLLAAYRENEELINLGAYARGSNPEVDEALEKMTQINLFLRQKIDEGSDFKESLQSLKNILQTDEEDIY